MWHKCSILVTCCQVPLERSVLFRRLSGVRSGNRESCAWSCGALSRLFQAEKSKSSLSSSWEAELGCSRADTIGFVTPSPCKPPTVCYHASSAASAAFGTCSLAVALSFSSRASRLVERAVSVTAAKRVSRGCIGKRPAVTPSWIIAWLRGLAAMSAPRCAGAAMSRTLLYPIPDCSRDRCPTSLKISAVCCSRGIVWRRM